MTQRIEHTPYEWTVWRGRFVLLKRLSFRLLWGAILYLSIPIAISPIVHFPIVLGIVGVERGGLMLLISFGIGVVGTMMSVGFYRLFKTDPGFLVPTRIWRVRSGRRLRYEQIRVTQATGSGGTLPSYPTRWLVLEKPNGDWARIKQVYHELDLIKANVALVGERSEAATPSH